ncbi:MAG: 5-bromo-4-chloroindolyl phosphate hydrolysis family protein [Clostridiales bacterium]|nr:5-bromo-4-chloroindolyl phosphate hydrolysis family protein [Clostridiales bacterium]
MAENGWDNFGRQILDTVDYAIRYGDFSNLSRSIGDIINNTIDAATGRRASGRRTSYDGNYDGDFSYSGASYGGNASAQRPGGSGGAARPTVYLFDPHPKGKAISIIMCAGGCLATFIFGILFLALLILALTDPLVIVGAVVFGALTALFLAVAVRGTRMLRFLNRYQAYIRMFRQRWNVPIRELADRVGKSIEFTVRDLQKMIDRRLFYQAHIDREQNYFILSDETYEAYRVAQQNYAEKARQQEREREQQNQREQEAQKADSDLPPESVELIRKGQDYIRHIHESNEAIPGEEISEKLDHMERVVTRIFDVVRAHPEVAQDLNKLMSYYLPTTQKLLDAYRELDSQPVAGEHISSTKREIEDTIDTLNTAFEKLLDSLFENRAWDISSDISVLHTILAQDGLKEDGLHSRKS